MHLNINLGLRHSFYKKVGLKVTLFGSLSQEVVRILRNTKQNLPLYIEIYLFCIITQPQVEGFRILNRITILGP